MDTTSDLIISMPASECASTIDPDSDGEAMVGLIDSINEKLTEAIARVGATQAPVSVVIQLTP